MPIYEYECAKCGEFEVTQRITDDPLKRCPKCRSKVRKLISNTSFQLKGSGWYITDYGRRDSGSSRESEKSTSESKSDSSSSEAKSSETKSSESKPAKKSAKAEGSKAA